MGRFSEDTFGLFEFGEQYAAFPLEITLSISERGEVTVLNRDTTLTITERGSISITNSDSNLTQTKRVSTLTVSR